MSRNGVDAAHSVVTIIVSVLLIVVSLQVVELKKQMEKQDEKVLQVVCFPEKSE